MRRCSKCKEEKHESEFHRSKAKKSGYNSYCKKCMSEYGKWHSRTERGKEICSRSAKKYHQTEKYKALKASYRKKNPEKHRAREAVRRAIRSGKIIRPGNCQLCGKECFPDAHHYNGYDDENRLTVEWLCKECHEHEDRVCESLAS